MALTAPTDPGPSNKIVRTFSDELSSKTPNETLARGLAAKVSDDRAKDQRLRILQRDWALLFQDAGELVTSIVPDEEAQLLEQSRRLAQAWSKFQRQLPDEQRQGLPEQLPSMNYLYHSVDTASKTWEDRRAGTRPGRLKRIFGQLCKTCENHSQLISILPTDDKYVRLLTGSLSAITQATVNHEKLAEAVSDSLDQLSHDIAFWNDQLLVHRDSIPMQRSIRDLYIIVFEFLTEIFAQWSKSGFKRFVQSFNKNAFDQLFTTKRTKMDAVAARLDRQAHLETQKRIRAMELNVQSTLDKVKSNQDREVDYQSLLKDLGSRTQQFLQQFDDAVSRSSLQIQQAATPQLILMSHSTHSESTPPSLTSLSENTNISEYSTYTRTSLLAAFAPLRSHLLSHHDSVLRMASLATHLSVSSHVATRLTRWTQSLHSSNLWIHGPHDCVRPSQNTLTAVSLVSLASRNSISCFSYFCSLPDSKGRLGKPTKLLNDLIVSLLFQFVMILPDKISTRIDFSPERLTDLIMNLPKSLPETLLLFQELRRLAPKYMLIIIDGVQCLEDLDDYTHTKNLKKLMTLLCTLPTPTTTTTTAPPIGATVGPGSEQETEETRGQTTKLCLTSNGLVNILSSMVQKKRLQNIEFESEET